MSYKGFFLKYATTTARATTKSVMSLVPIEVVQSCTGLSSTFYTTSTIISPNYPSSYPNGVSCTWTLQVNSGNRIQIDVTYFETESSHDKFYITDGTSSYSRQWTLSGSRSEFYFISSGKALKIKFTSDSSKTYSGFYLKYRKTLSAGTYKVITRTYKDCGNKQSSDFGSITSPNYPNRYSNGIRCEWLITVPKGNKVIIQFNDFQTESNNDFVYLYDGNISSTLMAHYGYKPGNYMKEIIRLSGSSTPSLQRIPSHSALVQFETDSSGTQKGFKLTFSTYPGCFSDAIRSAFTHAPNASSFGRAKTCLLYCKSRRYTYAAVSESYSLRSSMCYCGNLNPNSRYMVNPRMCSKCLYETWQKCGGNGFFSVYFNMSFKSICESSSENINCPFGYDINVTYANYGRLPEVKTLSCPTSQPNANCSSSKSLPYVKNRCDGIRSCDLGASDSYFGDPCSGVKKTLDVLYECEIDSIHFSSNNQQPNNRYPGGGSTTGSGGLSAGSIVGYIFLAIFILFIVGGCKACDTRRKRRALLRVPVAVDREGPTIIHNHTTVVQASSNFTDNRVNNVQLNQPVQMNRINMTAAPYYIGGGSDAPPPYVPHQGVPYLMPSPNPMPPPNPMAPPNHMNPPLAMQPPPYMAEAKY